MRTGPLSYLKELFEGLADSEQPLYQAQAWFAVMTGAVLGYALTWNW